MTPRQLSKFADDLQRIARFASDPAYYDAPSDPGPPGDPPRPGLVWKVETQRWVRPDGVEAGGATTRGGYTSPPAELRGKAAGTAGPGAAAAPKPTPGPSTPPARTFPKFPEKKFEVSPGLTPPELEHERMAQEYAFQNYEKIRDEYLAKPGNAVRDAQGNIRSITLNTDEWREFLPGYTGTNAQLVHEGASWLNKALYAEALQKMAGKGNGKIMVLAGGGGSGKGSADKFFEKGDYPIVLDQVSDSLPKLEAKLAEAAQAGYEPDFLFVDRPPAEAWDGVVGRAQSLRKKGQPARTVRVDAAPKANIEARKVALALLQKRPDVPVKVLDNRAGFDRQLLTDRGQVAQYLAEQIAAHGESAPLIERLAAETAAKQGTMDEDILAGLLGPKRYKPRAEQMGERFRVAATRATRSLSRFAELDRLSRRGA